MFKCVLVKHTLREDGIDGKDDQREEGGGAYDEPDNMADQYPGEEGTDIVHVERARAFDGEPFEVYLESGPGAGGGSEEFILGRSVEMREVRQTIHQGSASSRYRALRGRFFGSWLRGEFCFGSRASGYS